MDALFQSIVKKNESVQFDIPKIKEFEKTSKNNTKCKISVYSSDQDNPLTIYDCNELGSFTMPIPKDKQNVTVEFIFGQTILTVYAYESGKRHTKQKIEFDYHKNKIETDIQQNNSNSTQQRNNNQNRKHNWWKWN